MANIVSTTINLFPDDPMSEEAIVVISDTGFRISNDGAVTQCVGEISFIFSFNTHLSDDQIACGFNDGVISKQELDENADGIYKLQNMFRKAIFLNKLTIVPSYDDVGRKIDEIDFYAGNYSEEVHDTEYFLGEQCLGDFAFLSTDQNLTGGVLNEIIININNKDKKIDDLSSICIVLTGTEILELYDKLCTYNLFERKGVK